HPSFLGLLNVSGALTCANIPSGRPRASPAEPPLLPLGHGARPLLRVAHTTRRYEVRQGIRSTTRPRNDVVDAHSWPGGAVHTHRAASEDPAPIRDQPLE